MMTSESVQLGCFSESKSRQLSYTQDVILCPQNPTCDSRAADDIRFAHILYTDCYGKDKQSESGLMTHHLAKWCHLFRKYENRSLWSTLTTRFCG